MSLSSIPPAGATDIGPAYLKSLSAPIEIRDCIPQEDAGIINFARVPQDTSFAVLIRSVHGIDLNAANAIRLTIDDGLHEPYLRYLNADAVRVVKLDDAPDGRSTFLWVVYDRFLEPYMPTFYALNSHININVHIEDVEKNILQPAAFEFKIESAAEQTGSQQNLPKTEEIDVFDPLLSDSDDDGIRVVEGELAGTMVIYNSREPLPPRFESPDMIEEVSLASLGAVGAPLNLAPHTVFDMPVRLFIPVPEGVDIRSVGLAYYDGTQWLQAADAAGNVLPGGDGWMVPDSRINHVASSPSLIEVQVYHFSGTQAVVFASFDGTREDDRPSEENSSGAAVFVSCFVDSVSFDSGTWLWAIVFVGFLAVIMFLPFSSQRGRERSEPL